MRRTNKATIKVDGDLMRKKIEEKGMNMAEFGRDLGYDTTFISHTIARGTMTKPSYTLVSHALNCYKDELLLKEPEVSEMKIVETAPANDDLLDEIKRSNELLEKILAALTN